MDLPDTRYEMTKYSPIPPPLSDRNENIRRFSTDRKLTSDIQRRETFAQTIAKFAQTFYRDSLPPLIVLNARINRIVKPGLNRRVKPRARTTCAALDGVETGGSPARSEAGGDAIGRRDASRVEGGPATRLRGGKTGSTTRACMCRRSRPETRQKQHRPGQRRRIAIRRRHPGQAITRRLRLPWPAPSRRPARDTAQSHSRAAAP